MKFVVMSLCLVVVAGGLYLFIRSGDESLVVNEVPTQNRTAVTQGEVAVSPDSPLYPKPGQAPASNIERSPRVSLDGVDLEQNKVRAEQIQVQISELMARLPEVRANDDERKALEREIEGLLETYNEAILPVALAEMRQQNSEDG